MYHSDINLCKYNQDRRSMQQQGKNLVCINQTSQLAHSKTKFVDIIITAQRRLLERGSAFTNKKKKKKKLEAKWTFCL